MAGGTNLAIIFGPLNSTCFLNPKKKKKLCSFVGGASIYFLFLFLSFFLSVCVGLVFSFFGFAGRSAIFVGVYRFPIGKDLSTLSFRKHKKEN